jgi:hypothetical protein
MPWRDPTYYLYGNIVGTCHGISLTYDFIINVNEIARSLGFVLFICS